ncbi:hypothetical protein V6N11_074224 [Hibiscus sabdariffa]|uniref:DUF4283 domain-containing protein n=1 Tax=Hibiscus sabdariffa TaxID=183260 RepID=A0ABR2NJP3_9ROSI
MTLLWCVLSKAFEKKDKVISISILKQNFFRIKFPSWDTRNDILSRGPWTIKDSWLALAPFDQSHQIGDSLGAIIGKVIKIDTHQIDLNMVDYLHVGIILDVTKPIRRCVAIGDWLYYIPTKRQELVSRSKANIQYLDTDSSTSNLTNTGKISETSKIDPATKEDGHTSQPVNPSNPDNTTKQVAAVTQPRVVLAAGKTDASTNEDVDDVAVVAEEGVKLPTSPKSSPITLHANRNTTRPLAVAPTQKCDNQNKPNS